MTTTLRLELTCSLSDAHSLARVLRRIGGFQHVREFTDVPWPAGFAAERPESPRQPGRHAVEVRVADRRRAERAREIATLAASLLEADIRVHDEH